MTYLIPGEIITKADDIELNLDKNVKTITVSNSGDRPVQVGSHYHFYETNKALIFHRELFSKIFILIFIYASFTSRKR